MNDTVASIARAKAAVQWFAAQELHTIRVHYPRVLPSSTPLGACSCGKPYRLDEKGRPTEAPGLCLAPGKHPVSYDWNRGNLNTADDWDAPYNVGLMCGPEHGLLVLDVDVRNGGLETMMRLAPLVMTGANGWELVDTFSYFTSGHNGSRGYHLLFKPDGPAWEALVHVKAVQGIDLKQSGMVVAVPSLHATGTTYEFKTGDKAIRAIDEAAAVQLVESMASLAPTREEKTGVAMAPGESMETVKRWLMGFEVGELGEGERNNGMLPLVGAFVRLSMDGSTLATSVHELRTELESLYHHHDGVPEGLWDCLSALNRAVCRPPMPDEELATMLHNVFRSEVEKQLGAMEGVAKMTSRAPVTQAEHRTLASESIRSAGKDLL